jgi:hypothetical protein
MNAAFRAPTGLHRAAARNGRFGAPSDNPGVLGRLRCTRRFAGLIALSMAPLTGQVTWIVDAQGGGSFTTIQAAVMAANDGDIVLVRPTATYDWTLQVVAKGLSVLGAGPGFTSVTGSLSVVGLHPDQQFVIGNIDAFTPAAGRPCLSVRNSFGRLILTNSRVGLFFGNGQAAVEAIDAWHFAAHDSSIDGRPAIALTRSKLTATGTGFTGLFGQPYVMLTNPAPALQAVDSSASFANCDFTGGSVDSFATSAQPEPGMRLQRTAVILGGGQVTGGQDTRTTAQAPSIAMDGSSTVTIDSVTSLVHGIAGGQASQVERGRMRGHLAAPGAVGSFSFDGPNGDLGALAVAFPGPAQLTTFGTLWLDAPSIAVLSIGLLPVSGSVAIPASVLPGTAVAAQGLLLHQGVPVLSGPLLDAVR